VPRDRHLTGQPLMQGLQLFQQKGAALLRELPQEGFIQLREEAAIPHSGHQGAAALARLKARTNLHTGQVHQDHTDHLHPHLHTQPEAQGAEAASLPVRREAQEAREAVSHLRHHQASQEAAEAAAHLEAAEAEPRGEADDKLTTSRQRPDH